MLRNGKLLLALVVLPVVACGSGEKERALEEIDRARRELASHAGAGPSGLARDSIEIARDALLEAEKLVRGASSALEIFAETPSWQPELERALDQVEIASWVVERGREAQMEEAQEWLDSAAQAVAGARNRELSRRHFAVAANLRRAKLALDEAQRFFEAGELTLATEKAREAADLAGEVPPETRALFERFGDPAQLARWRKWVEAGIRESRRTGRPALVVDKRAHMAVLWMKGKPARSFDVELGYNGLERKLQQGDGATPEGLYRVVRKKGRRETKYYKALLLDYPNEEDRRRFREAKKNGDIQKESSIGNLIEVHGDGGRGTNWTDGCVAVTNEDMDILFQKLVLGSPVVIVGSYTSAAPREADEGGR